MMEGYARSLVRDAGLHVLAAHAAKRAEREQYAQFKPAYSLDGKLAGRNLKSGVCFLMAG